MEPQQSNTRTLKIVWHKEFHSPTLRRTVKPNEQDYLKHYKDALLFEINYLNKQKCSCMGCYDKRKRIEQELEEIFNLKVDENFQPD